MSYNKETGMYEGYIYCITNKVNNKKYVGQTTETVHKRWIRHINAHSNLEDDITQPDKSKIVYKEKNGKVYNSK